MKKFSDFIIKNNKIILIIMLSALILSSVGIYYFVADGRINSDMLVYLPENTSTTQGIRFLQENFDVKGDAFVIVEGEDNDLELAESVERIKQIKGVSQFVWIEDIENIDNVATLFEYFNINIEINTDELKNYLKQPINPDDENTKYNYVLLVLLDYSPSTNEAFGVHDEIRDELSGRNMEISGMTALAKQVMEETLGEVIWYLLFATIAVLIVLFLATSSFVEPFILIIVIGVSIIINMGTNLIFHQISIISFASCSVLQLGIAMDYAIFYMHTYKEKRMKLNPVEATEKTIPSVITTILASSLTTIGGFAALCFMQFQIGNDLSKVIIKGILLSLGTVVFLQPCLTILCDKFMQKTKHKEIMINFEKPATFFVKRRKVILVISLLLIIPAFLAQHNVDFSYLKIYDTPQNTTSQQIRAAELANQVIIAVPLETKEGRTHKDYIKDLEENERITNVVGAFSVIDMNENTLEALLDRFLTDPDNLSEEMQAAAALFKKVDGKWYTLYLIEISGDTEDEEAFATHSHLINTTNEYFSESYPLGVLTGVNDMAKVTPRDFLIVTIFSSLIILLIMSLLLKSFSKSFFMVVLIELAIWINISMNFIFGKEINFMIYIIISSIQLGCTVDYAILLSTRFEEMKKIYPDSATASIKAITSAFPAISTSASMIIVTCMTIVFVSKNLMVEEMAWILARGAFISYLMVVIVLPGLLVYFKKIPTAKEEIEKLKKKKFKNKK